jgi:hypothetical protein
MAQQAQAIEMHLLLPVITLAKTTSDFQVTLWQHDGFSVNFTSQGRKERWIKKINEVVNSKINELGVITKLEWTSL